jgi:hypothetical protein
MQWRQQSGLNKCVHNKTIQINYSRKAKERAELNIHGESIVKVAAQRV